MNVGSKSALNNVSLIYDMQLSEQVGFTGCLLPSLTTREQNST
jgi:hypothetical protein